MKKKVLIITGIIIAILGILGIWSLLNNEKSYDIRITIPAGTMDEIVFSPTGNKIIVSSGKGLGDTEVVLKPIEVKEENAYEPTYLTPGMPVEIKAEKGAWFKIGVNVQNPTDEDIDVYVKVTGVELRIE